MDKLISLANSKRQPGEKENALANRFNQDGTV